MRYTLSFILMLVLTEASIASNKDSILTQKIRKQTKTISNLADYDLDSAFALTEDLLLILDNTQIVNNDIFEAKLICGEVYSDVGNYHQALQIFQATLDLADSSVYPVIYAEVLYYMGDLYSDELEEYEFALDYYFRTIKILDLAEGINRGYAYLYYSIGDSYRFLKQYDSSKLYLEKSIQYWQKSKDFDVEDMIDTYLTYCIVLCKKNMTSQADQALDEIYAMRETKPFSLYTKGFLSFVEGIIFAKKKKYNEAIVAFLSSEKQTLALKYPSELVIIYNEMIPVIEASGDYEMAYEYQKKSTAIKEKLLNEEKIKALKNAEVKYDTDKKKEQIILLKQNQKIQKLEASQKDIYIYGLIAGALFLITVLIFIYRNSQIKSKNVVLLQDKNQQIETLMRELHHRVKNNLQVISSLLGLQSMKLKDPKAKEAVEQGKSRVKAMSMIHQRLYQNKDVAEIDFDAYVSDLVNDLKHSFMPDSNVKIELNIPKVNFDVDTTLPLGLILNELISNSFKYAFDDIKEPVLKVELLNKDNGYKLLISDNGKGMSNIIDLETSKSFGLKLVNLLVKQLKGEISFESNNGMNYRIEFVG